MIDGRLFLAIAAVICLGVFLNGARFARLTRNPVAGRTLLGMPVRGADAPVERLRFLGAVQIVAAPLVLSFLAALSFGLLGPVEGIQAIQFKSE